MDQEQEGQTAPGAVPLPGMEALGAMGKLQLPARVMEYLMAMPVSEWILICYSVLGAQASRHLGLIPDQLPQQPQLEEARLAVDAMTGLTIATESFMPYEDLRNMREVLEQLRELCDEAGSAHGG